MKTVVHEMRNQLSVAVANIEAFIDGKIEPTPARLNAVLHALGELDVLMNDLSRTESVAGQSESDASGSGGMATTMQSIDVCRLVLDEATAMEATAQAKGVRFGVHRCVVADPACMNFVGDPARIGQILKNVLLNAIRYTPPGGAVEVNCIRRDGALVFTVDDGGPGVSSEESGLIFERGFRGSASASTPGSGIGLALVKNFVEEQGGTISVGRAPEGGAEFVVTLPGRALPVDGCSTCGGLAVLE